MESNAQPANVPVTPERGRLRTFVDKNSVAVGAVTIVLLIGAGYSVYRGTRTPANAVWYYDTSNGTLVVISDSAEAQAKNTLFLAHVFACGKCPSSPDKAAYLESWTPEAAAAQKALAARSDPDAGTMRPGKRNAADSRREMETIQLGHLIARPDRSPVWIALGSREGKTLLDESKHCENGATAVECRP